MFIGRVSELDFLNKRYQTDGFDFIPIYGRRRIGKTELILEFIKDKKSIIYSAIEQTRYMSLVQFSEIIKNYFGIDYISTFSDWDQLFGFIGTQSFEEKLVIVIDEYPYLAKQSPELASVLQKHMDHTFKDRNIMFILSGSSMSFMENQVLGYQSPLYGRRTGQIKLQPFDYLTASQFLPEGTLEDKFLLYSVGGGIPQYLKILTSYATLDEGIVNSFFKTTGHLFEEPSNLLKQELREASGYFSIITAIATGKTKSNEIATTTGIDVTSLSKYLKALQDLGIIKKMIPFGKKKSNKGIYALSDNCFLFWFRFIHSNKTSIDYGRGELLWKTLKPDALSTYQGRIFEVACRSYLMNQNIDHKVMIQEIGSWWGNNPILKQQEEIDVVAKCIDGSYIFGECKWRNEKVGMSILDTLKRKSEIFNNVKDKSYYLFSKIGFTENLIVYAKHVTTVFLVEIKDMYND